MESSQSGLGCFNWVCVLDSFEAKLEGAVMKVIHANKLNAIKLDDGQTEKFNFLKIDEAII